MIDSRITNNSIGVCLYESSGNLFYHNSFIDIDEPVISNFQSPVSPPSGSYMINEWDNGFEGNYWSDYLTKYPNATGVDSSGVWNAPYVIDTNNTDNNPLMVPSMCNSRVSTVPNSTIIFHNNTGGSHSLQKEGKTETEIFNLHSSRRQTRDRMQCWKRTFQISVYQEPSWQWLSIDH